MKVRISTDEMYPVHHFSTCSGELYDIDKALFDRVVAAEKEFVEVQQLLDKVLDGAPLEED